MAEAAVSLNANPMMDGEHFEVPLDTPNASAEAIPWIYTGQAHDTEQIQQAVKAFNVSVGTEESPLLKDVTSRDITLLVPPHEENTLEESTKELTFNFPEKCCTLGDDFRFSDKDIRYLSIIQPSFDSPCPTKHLLLLSVMSGSQKKTLYLKPQDPEELLLVLNGLRRLIYGRFMGLPMSDNEKIETLNLYRPILSGWLNVNIVKKQLGLEHITSEEHLFCILDVETMSLFAKQIQESPTYELNFWLQAGPTVVERVLLNRIKDKITFETMELNAEIEAVSQQNDELLKVLKIIVPKPKDIFAEPKNLLEFHRKTTLNPWSKVGFDKDYHRRRAIELVKKFEDTMEKFSNNEVMTAAWEAANEEFTSIIASGLVPGVETESAGMNPDDVTHFQQNVLTIQEDLKLQRYELALAHVRGCIKVFSVSEIPTIRDLMTTNNEIQLLKKFFISLVSSEHEDWEERAEGGQSYPPEGTPVVCTWNDQSGSTEYRRADSLDEKKVAAIRSEMNEAMDQFAEHEDFIPMWVVNEEELKKLIADGFVPYTDVASGGLDPNNTDHLVKYIQEITDELQQQRYEMALSRVQGMRRIYSESAIRNVKQLLLDDDLTLLKKFFFRNFIM